MAFYIDGVKLDELAADPGTPEEGQLWYNTTDKRFKGYVNAVIQEVAHLADLEAGNVVVNATGFDGILSSLSPGPTDVQTALDTIDQRIFTGSSTPASTTDGAMWYNTSAGWNTMMVYDSSRSKWLGMSEWIIQFGHDNADGESLRGFGINVPGTGAGFLVPRNACIKRITVRTTTDNNLKRLDLYVNGGSVLNWNLVDDTNSSTYSNNSVNEDLDENDYVWVYVDAAGLAITDVAVCLWCSWRVTP